MCDSQWLLHLQYKNRIYAEDVIVSCHSWAQARMTTQAAQSSEAQALLHLCRNKPSGAWETLNAQAVSPVTLR